MPTYQYICHDCDHAFEKRLRMSQSGETQSCPTCGDMNTRKRIGAIAISVSVSGSGASSASGVNIPALPVSSPFS
ncbi:MAG: zinc ribbon domain-containing protein [Chloroflexi bacterium]|nr:zinc ribbon domain-containing protein [Chloroflexota bacterium]